MGCLLYSPQPSGIYSNFIYYYSIFSKSVGGYIPSPGKCFSLVSAASPLKIVLLMKIFFSFLFLFYVNNNFAQERNRIMIKAGQVASEVLTPDKIYQYPEFTNGRIIFRNQTSTAARLNYNYLNGEIEFIDEKHDTLAIAKFQMLNIQRVEIKTDTFYYDNGYLQQVLQTPLGRLAKRETLFILTKDKLGAFDRSTTTTGAEVITNLTDFFSTGNWSTITARENITLAYSSRFFFSDNYYTFLTANKKNLLKVFHSKKEMINRYLGENHVDFRNIDDLKKLLLFMQ